MVASVTFLRGVLQVRERREDRRNASSGGRPGVVRVAGNRVMRQGVGPPSLPTLHPFPCARISPHSGPHTRSLPSPALPLLCALL